MERKRGQCFVDGLEVPRRSEFIVKSARVARMMLIWEGSIPIPPTSFVYLSRTTFHLDSYSIFAQVCANRKGLPCTPQFRSVDEIASQLRYFIRWPVAHFPSGNILPSSAGRVHCIAKPAIQGRFPASP